MTANYKRPSSIFYNVYKLRTEVVKMTEIFTPSNQRGHVPHAYCILIYVGESTIRGSTIVRFAG